MSKDNLSFVKRMPRYSSQSKCYWVQVDMYNSVPATMRYYGLYYYWWYIRQYEECNKYPTMECHFFRNNNE